MEPSDYVYVEDDNVHGYNPEDLVSLNAQLKGGRQDELKGSVQYLLDPDVTKLPFETWADATPEQLKLLREAGVDPKNFEM